MSAEAESRPTTPQAAWDALAAGNDRYAAGTSAHPRQDPAHRASLETGQAPFTALFSCSDSRVPAELVFDVGLGDAFVVRNAGQIVSSSVVGSLEYAVEVLKTPLVVVVAHEHCGAVRAAIDSQGEHAPLLPVHISQLISNIVPAVRRVAGVERGVRIDTSEIDAHEVGRAHLRDTVSELLAASEIVSEAVAAGTLAVVGATYRLVEGRIEPELAVGEIDLQPRAPQHA
ncbi:carbonic anhydrase [Agromyces seonyuensis]|uniref:carbonic anhydrase n=1 Tax=Agromyces seonyuensis TaxID=2662446 RepID=A0A6I4P2M5_9MICO|nr:carbonic anhydrase [Agromyces seonyuensis]